MAENQEDDVVFEVPQIRRRLVGDFGRPSCLAPPPVSEHMKVYLRIRPFSEEEIERNESQGCLDVESDCVLKTVPPKDSHYYKEAARRLGKTIKTNKYTFSHIFKEETSQRDFFNSTTLNLVKDFIDGQNCLVYSYGVTSSGKTYTIQGEPDDAGVLPRALDVLFNSINGRQLSGMALKPDLFMGVSKLTPEQELYEQKVKERVMKMGCDDDMDVMSLLGEDASDISMATNTTVSSDASISSITRDFKGEPDFLASVNDRVREETTVSVEDQGQIKYSVWVSFAEIYNEQIFDLLEVVSKKKATRRNCLKLGEDQNGSPYVKGLKTIQVTSADEAYKLLTIGQRNLKTACTKLNQNSSRSHCIYNIRVLRVIDKDSPHISRVSMLSFCDLAGSERYAKTNTQGERLKEAGNINTSLMTLGRCIEMLRFNQSHKDNQKIIPFRDSKLTRLFQNYFVGRGKAVMIVNVNQLASMFDETQHVFKFSAIASQVITKQKPSLLKLTLPVESSKPLPRSSIMWASEQAKEKDAATDPSNVPLPEEESDEEWAETPSGVYTQENIDELIGVIDELQRDLDEAVRSKEKLETQIRKEVCDEMMKQFTKIEMQYSEHARVREQMAVELGEKRVQIVMNAERAKRKHNEMMKDQDDEWVSSLLLHQEKTKVEERNATIKEQREVIEKQAQEINALKAKIEDEDNSKSNLIENLTQQLQESRERLNEQETEVGELNDMLTEAGETFNQKESEIEKLKELNADYEKQLETLKDAYNQLERVASDSKVAMENADQSLSKREEFVSSLQAEIRDKEAEVGKYKNKARFFEEQIVKKEEETAEWRTKFENNQEESTKSQEALIHGFTAEISNLKSQIFNFKSQLYGVKSPLKSPGSSLHSPDHARMRLFSMSPRKTPGREPQIVLQCSPEKSHHHRIQIVCKKEHDVETESNESEDIHEESKVKTESAKSTLIEKSKELENANQKIKELEPLMKDYFCKSKQLKEAETKVEKLSDDAEYKNKAITDCEDRVRELEIELKESNTLVGQKEETINKLEGKRKELENIVTELKGSLTKDIQKEEVEVQTDLLERDAEPKGDNDIQSQLQQQIDERNNEVERLKDKLAKLMTGYKAKDMVVNEASEKYTDMEFRINEKEFENQEFKAKLDEAKKQMDMLQEVLNHKVEDLARTGEELAIASLESEKSKRMVIEHKANCISLTTEITSLKDKLQSAENGKVTGEISELKQTEKRSCVDKEVQSEDSHKQTENQQSGVLKSEVQQHEMDKSQLEKQLKILTEKHTALTDELKMLEELKESNISLKSQINDKDKLCKDMSVKVIELEEANSHLETEFKQATGKTNDIKTLKGKLREKEEELEMFKENLDATLAELESMEINQGEFGKLQKNIEEQEVKINEKEKQISELGNMINGKEQELSKLGNVITEKEQEINELRNVINMKEQEIVKLGNVISEKEKESSDLGNVLKEIEQESNKLGNVITEKEEEITKLTNVINMKEQEITKLEKVICKKEQESSNLGSVMSERKQESNKLGNVITEKEQEITKLGNALNEKEQEIGNLGNVLTEKEQEITKLGCVITEKEHEITKFGSLLKEKEQEISQLGNVITDKKREISKLGNEVNEKQQEIVKLADLKKESQNRPEHVNNTENDRNLEKGIHDLESVLVDKEMELCEKEKLILEQKSVINDLRAESEKYEDGNKELVEKIASIEKEKVEEVSELETMVKENNERIEKISCELEEAKREKEVLDEKIEELEKKLCQVTEEMEETTMKNKSFEMERIHFQEKLDEAWGKVYKLEDEVEEMKLGLEDELSDIKSRHSEPEIQNQTKQEVLDKQEDVTKYKDLYEKLEGELKSANCELEKVCELQLLYDNEKKKNAEYEKLLSETNESNCLSPQTGVRRLRKAKIDAENALVEARFKIGSLESKINDLESKQRCLENNKLNSVVSPSANESLFQRKINIISLKLQETESKNEDMIKEIVQLKCTVDKQGRELEEERSNPGRMSEVHRRSRVSAIQQDPRQSISSPGTRVELGKTLEREQNLRDQLKESNEKIKEWLSKLTDTENQLTQKKQELKLAQETIRQLKAQSSEGERNLGKEVEQYMETISELKIELIKKEGELEEKTHLIEDLRRQLERKISDIESYDKERKDKEEVLSLIKETLQEQEAMLEQQDKMINTKEGELEASQQEHKTLLEKYQQLLESKDSKQKEVKVDVRRMERLETERDQQTERLKHLENQLVQTNKKLDTALQEKIESDKKLKKVEDEKSRMKSAINENNLELKELEKNLTDVRSECEDLRSQGADKNAAMHLEEAKRDMETSVQELNGKVRNLQCRNKELTFKLSSAEEKIKTLTEDDKHEKHAGDAEMQKFRDERDKLVSALESCLKKKDTEIHQLKEVIKQLKEKEMHLTQNWHEEREKIASGLIHLQKGGFSNEEEMQPTTNCDVTQTPSIHVDTRDDEQDTFSRPPEPDSAKQSATKSRGNRKSRKRPSPTGADELPPLPKRRSREPVTETSMMSESSEDYSTHLQVDATPKAAAKSLRRMRKKTGSVPELEEKQTEEEAPRVRASKRTAKNRLLQSFRESPIGKTSKKLLDNIAETFSPLKSPTKSPTKSSPCKDEEVKKGRQRNKPSKENVPVAALTGSEKKSRRGRGHTLYSEDTYISQPFESSGDFIQSPENIHKTVTRSLRSKRH